MSQIILPPTHVPRPVPLLYFAALSAGIHFAGAALFQRNVDVGQVCALVPLQIGYGGIRADGSERYVCSPSADCVTGDLVEVQGRRPD